MLKLLLLLVRAADPTVRGDGGDGVRSCVGLAVKTSSRRQVGGAAGGTAGALKEDDEPRAVLRAQAEGGAGKMWW